MLKRFRSSDQTDVPRDELVARFEVRERFLSPVELLCHRRLCNAVGDRAIVCPKPRVLESLRLLNAHRHLDDAMRIERKHIDFLICDPNSGHPMCAVQIDWWDEDKQEYRARERLLEQAFSRANLPVAHIPSNQLPGAVELRKRIADLMGLDFEPTSNKADFACDPVPTLPNSENSDFQRD